MTPASERAMRLFACACCRSVWQWLADDSARRLVEKLEYVADGIGGSSYSDLVPAMVEITSPTVGTVFLQSEPGAPPYVTLGSLVEPDSIVCSISAMKISNIIPAYHSGVIVEVCTENEGFIDFAAPLFRLIPTLAEAIPADWAQCRTALSRDIFPSSRRMPRLVASTPDAFSIAQAAYNERLLPTGELDNVRLSILADALEDSGCTNADILAHLRSPGPHVRGCWALDLVLGKE
jgi:biotin carboxyl carrier protein